MKVKSLLFADRPSISQPTICRTDSVTHRLKFNKIPFYFRAFSEHLPARWSTKRIGCVSSRSCRRQSAFLHAHLGDKFTVVRGPLICRPVISSLTTTQHFWLSGRRSCGDLGFPLSVPC